MGKSQKNHSWHYGIIGAGPVGCIVAAFLTRGGHTVTLCDIVPELVDPARERGIIIEGAERLEQKIPRTCNQIEELIAAGPDAIFVCVKAQALPLISSALGDLYKEGIYIVSWQNGIDTEYELAKVLGKTPVMRAVVNWGCGLLGPAHVTMPFHHPPHYIQELDPASIDAAVHIARDLTASGLTTEHTDRIVPMVWRKTVMNASMNPVCAATGLTMAQAMGDPMTFGVVDALLKECLAVARGNEIFLGWDYYQYAVEYLKSAGNHKPSMLMDIEASRRTEINYINGKFVEYGTRAGVQTPYNNTMRSLIKGIEFRLETRR
ncbi:ketopantoate reductase family protein [Desulfosarcina ovata]|uniref:2-dehydropantoate 2-reductase n=2 Tax=Desulfosarcina ovata TaxID=83564 RepID=A0A5K8ADR0_9BACT|nr:2-dehydropantoate 2-reductase [Desulfosarcina ovata]BBO84219.1 putative 2-dehydropantoate 2-reductase [Desulfosarcina ovata subsp. sediminis]BBO90717.1 putative 2-dehydropantoate 2-reductase [Desulfosarcina ovata subsp. ovata]